VANPILFYVDEHIPVLEIRRILRDHLVEFPDLGTKDPAILEVAEQAGAIILTSDRWFYNQIRRDPYADKLRGRFTNAGVVLLAGEWAIARKQITTWLPLIETVVEMQRQKDDRRVVIRFKGDAMIYVDQ
jgi:hypothetical protein